MKIHGILAIFLFLTIIGCRDITKEGGIISPSNTPTTEENVMMFVTVQLTTEAATNLRQQTQPTVQVSEVLQIAADLNVTLEPMHSAVDSNSVLATYFTVAVADATQGEMIAKRFQEAEAVEAAYFKLPGQPP